MVFKSPALYRHLGNPRMCKSAESANAGGGSRELKDRDKAVNEFHSFFRPNTSNLQRLKSMESAT